MEQLLTTEKAFWCAHSFVLAENTIRLVKEFDPEKTDKRKVESAFAWLKLLNFPTIARTFSYSDGGGKLSSITSEFVPGDSLERLHKSGLRLTDSQTLIVAYGIARAFDYMESMKQAKEGVFQNLTYVVKLDKDLEPFLCDLDFDWYATNPGDQREGRYQCNIGSYVDVLNKLVTVEDHAKQPLASVMEKRQGGWKAVIQELERIGGYDTEFVRYKQALNRKLSEGSWPEEGLLSRLEHGVPVDLSIKAELLELAFRKNGNNEIADMYKRLCGVAWNYPKLMNKQSL